MLQLLGQIHRYRDVGYNEEDPVSLDKLTPLRVVIPTLCSDQDLKREFEDACNFDASRGRLDKELRSTLGSVEHVAVDIWWAGYDTREVRLAIQDWMNLGREKFEPGAVTEMQNRVGHRFLVQRTTRPEEILYGVAKFLQAVDLSDALNNRYNGEEKNVMLAVLRTGNLEEKLEACNNFLRPYLEGQISRMLGNDTP